MLKNAITTHIPKSTVLIHNRQTHRQTHRQTERERERERERNRETEAETEIPLSNYCSPIFTFNIVFRQAPTKNIISYVRDQAI